MIVDYSKAATRSARARIEHEIDRLIRLLDEIDGDLDFEPGLGWPEGGPDQLDTDFAHDDREEEDEHGGDVQDEPHDPLDEGNDEPDLGWRNPGGCDELPADWHQPDECFRPGASLTFDGSGRRLATNLLRQRTKRRAPTPSEPNRSAK